MTEGEGISEYVETRLSLFAEPMLLLPPLEFAKHSANLEQLLTSTAYFLSLWYSLIADDFQFRILSYYSSTKCPKIRVEREQRKAVLRFISFHVTYFRVVALLQC